LGLFAGVYGNEITPFHAVHELKLPAKLGKSDAFNLSLGNWWCSTSAINFVSRLDLYFDSSTNLLDLQRNSLSVGMNSQPRPGFNEHCRGQAEPQKERPARTGMRFSLMVIVLC
jgi:hypothetical protein